MPTHQLVHKKVWHWAYKWGWLPYYWFTWEDQWRWVYHFECLTYNYFMFWEHDVGCEAGHKFSWWRGCFNLFGVLKVYNVTLDFAAQLADQGPCKC